MLEKYVLNSYFILLFSRKIPTFSYFLMKIPTFSYFLELSYNLMPCQSEHSNHMFISPHHSVANHSLGWDLWLFLASPYPGLSLLIEWYSHPCY